jgi:hypothetical protein
VAGSPTLEVHYRDGGADSDHAIYSLVYDASDVYFRFYVSDGFFYIDFAPDNGGVPGAWATKWLIAASALPSLTTMRAKIDANGSGSGNWTFDNVNL